MNIINVGKQGEGPSINIIVVPRHRLYLPTCITVHRATKQQTKFEEWLHLFNLGVIYPTDRRHSREGSLIQEHEIYLTSKTLTETNKHLRGLFQIHACPYHKYYSHTCMLAHH
ncbi:hypothetical protein MANES_14G136021v8 [Manihot esculenta]|uniref:Uncharacterized protein n=1 Tax=Manihot esculenta TaxID=3983 RepID=A0ACB7GFU3_MANES|nr:hypothetical protein MANES_14G136021v8 [Manihot esculenta]